MTETILITGGAGFIGRYVARTCPEHKCHFRVKLAERAEWVAKQEAKDLVQEARKELEARGLVA